MSQEQAAPGVQSIEKGIPLYQRWQDYRRSFQWRTGTDGSDGSSGFHRMEYPALEAPLVSGRLIMLPTGQAAPDQKSRGDTVYLGIEGEVELTVGDRTFTLKPLDLISIPAYTPYRYVNVGLTNALLCGVFATEEPSMTGANRLPDAGASPQHMVWERYRRDFRWTLPLAEQWGYHRGSGPLIIVDGLRGHTVRQPTGQSTPWHYAARDMLFMGISHEVEFKAAGREWPLGPYDFLVVPAGTPYTYTNYGLSESLFFSIGGKLPPGKKGTYFDGDPGWPIRPDAKTLRVEIDPYGDARVVHDSSAAARR